DPQWTGSLALGSEFGRIELVQAPSNTGAFLIASLATAATPLASFGLPGCTLLVDPAAPDHLATAFLQTNNVGEAGLDLPIPGFVPRTSIFFQWALLEPGSNAAGARLTRGLDVAFRR
ncbi:MAG: hypothetical protein KDE27_08180, partial [Planctomycetes bacterium]|nr:hypothetical protein [Planctomycetota bacterium]